MAAALPATAESAKIVLKVGLLGDSQIGKTTLMVRYVDGKYDEDYIETLGVNFMEKLVRLRNLDVTISVWDLGGQKEFATLMPLVCADARVMVIGFDLTTKASLFAVKRWYKEARKESKSFAPFLVGMKYDLFEKMPAEYKTDITKAARKFSAKMKAPLIYCSSADGINVKKIFKIILGRVFSLKAKIEENSDELSGPICEYNIESRGDVEDGDGDGDGEPRKKKKKKRKKKKDRSATEPAPSTATAE